MAVSPTFACNFQESIGAVWLQEKYWDFTVEVEGKVFKCHRAILGSCSDFFRALLDSGMRESVAKTAVIENIDKKTFATILKAMYTGVDDINGDNVYQVWSAVHQLQIKYLILHCENFVMENMSKKNCVRTFQQARLLDSHQVLQCAQKCMSQNFEAIIMTKAFQELPADALYNLLQDKQLNVHSEDIVLVSILEWVNYHPVSSPSFRLSKRDNESNMPTLPMTTHYSNSGEDDSDDEEYVFEEESSLSPLPSDADKVSEEESSLSAALDRCNVSGVSGLEGTTTDRDVPAAMRQQTHGRLNDMEKLLSAVRLYLVSPACLATALGYVTSRMYLPQVCQKLIDALTYVQNVDRRHFVWPEPAIHRASSDQEHVMIFFNATAGVLQAYRFESDVICNIVINCPPNVKTCLGICVNDNRLLLSTGQSVFALATGKETWVQVLQATPSTPPVHFSAQSNIMYQIQGRELQRCSMEFGYMGVWQTFYTFSDTYNAASTLMVFPDRFIIFPPNNADIVSLDLNGKKERRIAPIEGPVQNMVSFSNGRKTYILQRNGFLRELVSARAEKLSFDFITELWNGDWTLHGAVLFQNQLFVFATNLPEKAYELIVVPSLKGVFKTVKIVNIQSSFTCWPIVIPKAWMK